MNNKHYSKRYFDDNNRLKLIYKSLFLDAIDAIVIADENLCVVSINDRFTELFGYKLEDIVGKNLDNIIAKRDVVDEAKKMTKSLINGKEINIDSVRYNSDGNEVEVNVKVFPIVIESKVIGGYGIYSDISSRKSEERELIRQNSNFKALFENSTDAIVMLDTNHCVVDANYNFIKLFEYELEEIKGKDIDGLITNKEVEKSAEILSDKLFEGEEVNLEAVRYDSKGNEKEVTVKAVPIIVDDKVIGGYAIYTDISSRKNVERELLKQNSSFKALFENSLEAIVMIDINHCIVNINDEFTKLFGYKLEDIMGKDIDKLVANKSNMDEAEKLTKESFFGIGINVETIRYGSNGKEREVSIKGIPITIDGEIIGGYGIYSDISLRKSVERELIKQNSNFKALFVNTKEAIVLLDENHCIIDINSEFVELFGYKLEEIIGRNLDDVIGNEKVIKDAKEITKDLFKGIVANSEGFRYGINGIEKEVSIRGVPVIIEGKVVGGYGIYSDISQRKNAQRKITYISYHDELTGLYNRRFFEEEIQRLDTIRNYPISIVYGDVNGLKYINDNYGHKQGDKLLKKVAEIIKSEIRSDDIVARTGGDEFIALLPKTKIEDSERIVDRIKNKCSDSYNNSCKISVAFGIDAKTESTQDIVKIIKIAEDKMYIDKKISKEIFIKNVDK